MEGKLEELLFYLKVCVFLICGLPKVSDGLKKKLPLLVAHGAAVLHRFTCPSVCCRGTSLAPLITMPVPLRVALSSGNGQGQACWPALRQRLGFADN